MPPPAPRRPPASRHPIAPPDAAGFAPGPPPAPHARDSGSADIALGGPAARASAGVTGAGVRIGILSDSFDALGGAAGDIAAGRLPAAGVTVLKDGPPDAGSDEGRAMAQLIHATAPDAELLFYTAFDGEADFAAGIDALRQAGCDIIVDDITYPDEPMFQLAGPINAAVQRALDAGVDYFTAVGNEGRSFYEAAFTPVSTLVAGISGQPILAQRFAGGAASQAVTIPAGAAVTLTLEWDAPYGADTPASLAAAALLGGRAVARSAQSGREPEVFFTFPVQNVTVTYSLVIFQAPGAPAPGLLKYVLEGGGSISGGGAGIGSGSAIGHALVPGANAVGAVDVEDTPAQGGAPAPEAFSSSGPGMLLFSPDGARLAAPQPLAVPAFLAPDGAATSVIDPFFGTSAAAPAAAAVAALLLQADAGLTNADVTFLLIDSAIPAGAASVAGAGLIQADRAVAYAATRVISGSVQPTIHGTSRGGTINATEGAQWVFTGDAPTAVLAAGADTVVTGAGADTVDLAGVSGAVLPGAGALLVNRIAGQATVAAGPGSVTVLGGAGGGLIHGGAAGHNALTAGDAATTLVAGGAGDTLVAAGAGGDLLMSDVAGPVTLSAGGSTGGNTFSLAGSGGGLVLAGPGANSIFLGAGDNVVVISDGSRVSLAV